MKRKLTFGRACVWSILAVIAVLVGAALFWRGDILRAGLDPQVPFQTYDPPPAPDYALESAWVAQDARLPQSGPAAVFFLHSTTYDGGREWNGPIGDEAADAYLKRVVLPNFAGPFVSVGALSIPRYRQASLYSRLTLRDDARDARAFSYQDALAAFNAWLGRHPEGPIVLVGVEQGGELMDRLLRERVAGDRLLRQRLVAAYLIDVVIATENTTDFPPCAEREQTGCVVAFSAVETGDEDAARRRLRRALVWDDTGRLVDLAGRPTVCVNPVDGASGGEAPARRHLGAANATGLEWGVRPAFQGRLIATRCEGGLLRYDKPDSSTLRNQGSWTERRKTQPYNLFYADLEADAQVRLRVWRDAVSRTSVPLASQTELPTP